MQYLIVKHEKLAKFCLFFFNVIKPAATYEPYSFSFVMNKLQIKSSIMYITTIGTHINFMIMEKQNTIGQVVSFSVNFSVQCIDAHYSVLTNNDRCIK